MTESLCQSLLHAHAFSLCSSQGHYDHFFNSALPGNRASAIPCLQKMQLQLHPTATKQPSEECLVHGIFVNQNLKCCTLSYKPLRVSLRQKSLKRVALGCKVATARNGDQETDEHRHPMGTEMSGHNTRSRVPSPRCL